MLSSRICSTCPLNLLRRDCLVYRFQGGLASQQPSSRLFELCRYDTLRLAWYDMVRLIQFLAISETRPEGKRVLGLRFF